MKERSSFRSSFPLERFAEVFPLWSGKACGVLSHIHGVRREIRASEAGDVNEHEKLRAQNIWLLFYLRKALN